MRLWPETLKLRAILILCSVFTLSHILNLLIYESNREHTIFITEANDLAARIVGIVDLAQALPAENRQYILSAAETQFLATLPDTDHLTVSSTCQDNEFAQLIRGNISNELADTANFDINVCVGSVPHSLLPGSSDDGFEALITMTFPDGEDFTFHANLPAGPSLMDDISIIYLILTSVMALLIAGYLIWRAILPLEQLSRAADEIGLNIETQPLAESGPLEVRAASRAFNRMQGRIQHLLHSQVEMISAISHDLRSAVTRLQLRTEMLDAKSDRQGMLRVVLDMRQMVEAMIAFMRGLNPNEQPLETRVDELISHLCEDMIAEGAPINYGLRGQACHTRCRRTSLRRAFQNIIDNAIKYGESAEVEIDSDSKRLVVTIRDNGPGVPEADMQKILSPFYRLEQSRNEYTGGIGLGLSIADNIVRSHGGVLMLSNSDQGGLLVKVELPSR